MRNSHQVSVPMTAPVVTGLTGAAFILNAWDGERWPRERVAEKTWFVHASRHFSVLR